MHPGGTPDEIDARSEQARRGLDRALQVHTVFHRGAGAIKPWGPRPECLRYSPSMTNTQPKAQGRGLYLASGILTVVYLATLGAYVFFNWRTIRLMPANEVGDFLAGAFSPLAFAWLVLGFIQQGIELRQNSAALLLQAEELRNAAKHAGDMVELQRKEFELRIEELEKDREKAQLAAVADSKRREAQELRREAEAVRRMQPRFHFELLHRNHERKHLAVGELSNGGVGCTNVRIDMVPIEGVLKLAGTTEFETFDSELSVPVKMISMSSEHTHPLTVHYTDALGNERLQNFIVSAKSSYLQITEQRAEEST